MRGNPGQRKLRPDVKWRKDGSIPAPPRFLGTGLARDEWLRISDELHRLGLLTGADLNAFAAYCMAFERWIEAEKDCDGEYTTITTNGNVIQNPSYGIARKACYDMMRYATEFGLTPASRTRIAVNAEEAGDEFDGLIKH
jgi:P27 family predicted phage terminase small subunit